MGRKQARTSRRVDRDVQAIGALTQAVLNGDDLEELFGRIAREARVLVDAFPASSSPCRTPAR